MFAYTGTELREIIESMMTVSEIMSERLEDVLYHYSNDAKQEAQSFFKQAGIIPDCYRQTEWGRPQAIVTALRKRGIQKRDTAKVRISLIGG